MTFFESASLLPEDPILNLQVEFSTDPRPNKINLGIGAYNDAKGHPVLLSTVRKAERALIDSLHDKEYLPIVGNHLLIHETFNLVFGKNAFGDLNHRLFGVQSVGGTGALRLAADFFVQHTNRTIFISDPSWPNHRLAFTRSGLKVETYPYYDFAKNKIYFSSMLQVVKTIPSGSVILLQAGCHNPTGMDLTYAEWQELSLVIKKRQIFPFFDFAYQGFGSGIEEDAIPIRLFVNDGHTLFVASSYSKNMGLYGERVGVLSCLFNDNKTAMIVASHLKQIIRAMYSTPPIHGAQIASHILRSPQLKQEWVEELQKMRERVHEMRLALAKGLLAKSSSFDFTFMKDQNGLFSLSGLNPDQVLQLKQKYAIYMPTNGRINVAGLNTRNLDAVIKAILSVI
jgi:aspartate aminotransferase